jgi:hypothetical protein
MHPKTIVLSLLFAVVPCLGATQTLTGGDAPLAHGETRPGRFTVEVTAGSTLRGGSVQSASVGFLPAPWLTLLVQGERFHEPTRVNYFENGSSISRGFTTLVVGGEVRVGVPTSRRVSGYGALGLGTGTWQSNVNQFFRERNSGPVRTAYAGGGARFRIHRNLSVVADARVALAVSDDSVFGYVPIRAGLAWDF